MSDKSDLTRWNRAGLSRFRYIDNNAVTYLEQLRQTLEDRFPNWKDLKLEIPDPDLEKVTRRERDDRLHQRQELLLEQYNGERRDWGWEIARSFARACHVLTEHIDAYANEGFLGTATQWDSVRRMVEMLDYHPAPPASASTVLVL